ncbi:MAG: EamA family transporter [Candidatus Dojkabacteria bacterium]|nr:EamA family transporter [Candidatus Dojkabacteria bacterium]
MTTLLITIILGILLGLMYVFNKLLSSKEFHPATFSVLYSLISAILILPFALAEFRLTLDSPLHTILAIISPICFGLAFYFGLKAYKTTDVSTVSLFSRLSLPIGAFSGILILSEEYLDKSYLGLALVMLGGLLVVYEKGKIILNKGIFYSFLMAFGYGIIIVFDKIVLEKFSPFTYVLTNNTVIVIAFLTYFRTGKEVIPAIKKYPVLIFLSALFGVSSWAGFLKIIEFGEISKIYPIWESVALVTTVLVGIIFLKEKGGVVQKIIGSTMTVAGIFLI